jgi:hypothetical protein
VVWALVLPIGLKLWVKLRFMRDLRPRTPPRATSDTTGQELHEDGSDLKTNGQGDLPSVPSIVPEYDRTTMHGSVAPPVEPFAAGLVGMLPPAEARLAIAEARVAISEPPPSNRGPMVIRVDVPSLSPMGASISPAASGPTPVPGTDGQLSAMARLAAPAFRESPAASVPPERDDDDDARGHISSVMPSAHTKTPASMVPSSEGPEIHVGVLSMPHLRSERPAFEPAAAPTVITMGPNGGTASVSTPAPAPAVLSSSEPASTDAAVDPHADERSGVRHVLLANAPGLLREACSPVVLNRCS